MPLVAQGFALAMINDPQKAPKFNPQVLMREPCGLWGVHSGENIPDLLRSFSNTIVSEYFLRENLIENLHFTKKSLFCKYLVFKPMQLEWVERHARAEMSMKNLSVILSGLDTISIVKKLEVIWAKWVEVRCMVHNGNTFKNEVEIVPKNPQGNQRLDKDAIQRKLKKMKDNYQEEIVEHHPLKGWFRHNSLGRLRELWCATTADRMHADPVICQQIIATAKRSKFLSTLIPFTPPLTVATAVTTTAVTTTAVTATAVTTLPISSPPSVSESFNINASATASGSATIATTAAAATPPIIIENVTTTANTNAPAAASTSTLTSSLSSSSISTDISNNALVTVSTCQTTHLSIDKASVISENVFEGMTTSTCTIIQPSLSLSTVTSSEASSSTPSIKVLEPIPESEMQIPTRSDGEKRSTIIEETHLVPVGTIIHTTQNPLVTPLGLSEVEDNEIEMTVECSEVKDNYGDSTRIEDSTASLIHPTVIPTTSLSITQFPQMPDENTSRTEIEIEMEMETEKGIEIGMEMEMDVDMDLIDFNKSIDKDNHIGDLDNEEDDEEDEEEEKDDLDRMEGDEDEELGDDMVPGSDDLDEDGEKEDDEGEEDEEEEEEDNDDGVEEEEEVEVDRNNQIAIHGDSTIPGNNNRNNDDDDDEDNDNNGDDNIDDNNNGDNNIDGQILNDGNDGGVNGDEKEENDSLIAGFASDYTQYLVEVETAEINNLSVASNPPIHTQPEQQDSATNNNSNKIHAATSGMYLAAGAFHARVKVRSDNVNIWCYRY